MESKRCVGKKGCGPGENVAEASGFATDLSQSAYLAHTIGRAISAAEQRSHRYVTLEHLLVALLDDPDGLALLEGARANVPGLRGAANETVNHNLATLYTPGAFDLRASYKVERVLQSASDDARRMGCTEVDGAFVTVALFHETDSPAYELLKRHNFVFHAANAWLDRNRGVRFRAPAVEAPIVVPMRTEPDDNEILLDDIVEDAAPKENGSPTGEAAETGVGEEDIEPVTWPVIRPGSRLQPGSGESENGLAHAAAPRRTTAVRSAAANPEQQPREEPDFAVTAAQPRPLESTDWEIGPAVPGPSLERADAGRDARGIGAVIPGRGQGGDAGEAASDDNEDGERDQPSVNASDVADGRLRPYATTRARLATASRPVVPDPVRMGAEALLTNGAAMRQPAPADSRAQPASRTDPNALPGGRLDDTRTRPIATPPAPAPSAKPAAKKPVAPRDVAVMARGRRRTQPVASSYFAKLADTMPRRMCAFKPSPVEVRIPREETETFLSALEGGAEVGRRGNTVTQAMSVTLRAPDGGFIIQSLGPETQWILKRPTLADKEAFGRWIWTVTPTETGKRRLQLVVTGRSVDDSGLADDTALPEQVITVSVRANYARSFGKAMQWLLLMALGGGITEGAIQLIRILGV
jgi:neural Wiskott-Aldrich syndrome protein